MRKLLVLLAAWHAANGLFMLAAPHAWYGFVPGVIDTGAANVHFIRDVGLGFLAAAAGLFLASRGTADRLLLVPAIVFLGGHAGLHLAEMVTHGATAVAAMRDIVPIVIPAVLPLLAFLPRTTAQTRNT
ncbi:hypothetical protein [Sinorhizobium fredii]|uniref:hypothetical protein n=1 Tax=Rhizobium fredii TaxID=380 RepID=UPI003519A404